MASTFIDALLHGRVPIVMEVKRSDADGRPLMGERTIPEVVSAYVAAGAPCISVVTGRWFGGELAMLREVAALTDLPLLQKDFITREKQLAGAQEIGASAVLLTARILPKSTLQKLIEKALDRGLTPFVEVAEAAEVDSVVHAEECVIAINNKDIREQERGSGDIDTSRSLLDAVIQTGTPAPTSASAITDPKVAAALVDQGFKGLLIGTGLLQAPSTQGWVDEFTAEREALQVAAGRR